MNFVHQPEVLRLTGKVNFQLYVVASCLEGDAKRKICSGLDNTLVFTENQND